MAETSRESHAGPYREQDFDAAFVRSHRSDWGSVAVRALVIAAVYWLLARAVRSEQLSVGFVLLPLAVEFIAVFWIGWVMAKWFVHCDTFGKTARSFGLALFWTFAILGVMAARLATDPEADGFDVDRIQPNLAVAWDKVVRTGLLWAMLAAIGGLVVATIPEVVRWRRTGGVFVWTSIMNSGFRLGVMILLGFVAGLLAILGAEFLLPLLPEGRAQVWPWIAFWFLFLADVLTLVVVVLMHRDLAKKAQEGSAGAT